LFQSFQAAFLIPSFAATIRLQDISFAVEEVITMPRADGWTGYTTFAELRDQARDDRSIALCFYSPTAFSLGDTHIGKRFTLFPEPWRVFDSLCRKWNEFATAPFDAKQVRAWVEANVWISKYTLHTEMLHFDRFSQKGFVGSVVYEIKSDDAEMTRMVNALTDFALYAGVGYRTAWGMGQARRLHRLSPQEPKSDNGQSDNSTVRLFDHRTA
jgi:CRISPR-associated endoribonuclease Cas6